MNWRMLLGAGALVSATAIVTASVVSQDPPERDGHPGDMPEWMPLIMPGEAHEHLKPLVGTWSSDVRTWDGPDSASYSMETTAEYEMIMDGRFLKGEYRGTFNGHEWRGMDILGYDNMTQEYIGVWISNMSTGVMISRGRYDSEKNALVMSGTHPCPMTGNPHRPFRTVMRLDGERSTYEMYNKDEEGTEYKSLEVRSKRAASE